MRLSNEVLRIGQFRPIIEARAFRQSVSHFCERRPRLAGPSTRAGTVRLCGASFRIPLMLAHDRFRGSRLPSDACDVGGKSLDCDNDPVGFKTFAHRLEAVSFVEGPLDIGPKCSDLSCLDSRLYLAKGCEAGSRILALVRGGRLARHSLLEVYGSLRRLSTCSARFSKVRHLGRCRRQQKFASGGTDSVVEHKGSVARASPFLAGSGLFRSSLAVLRTRFCVSRS